MKNDNRADEVKKAIQAALGVNQSDSEEGRCIWFPGRIHLPSNTFSISTSSFFIVIPLQPNFTIKIGRTRNPIEIFERQIQGYFVFLWINPIPNPPGKYELIVGYVCSNEQIGGDDGLNNKYSNEKQLCAANKS